MRSRLWAISTVCKYCKRAQQRSTTYAHNDPPYICFTRIANKALNGFIRVSLQNYPAPWLSRSCKFKAAETVPPILKNRAVTGRPWKPKSHYRFISVLAQNLFHHSGFAVLFCNFEFVYTDLPNVSRPYLLLPQNGSWKRS